MKKNSAVVLFLIFNWFSVLPAAERGSSSPYISGDSFRTQCDCTFDELNKDIDFSRLKKGSTVFVKTDFLKVFFKKIHPRIRFPYVLVTHNSDHPSPGAFAAYLNDDKLMAWFGQNVESQHPKLHPIPIGIANRCWGHGNIEIIHNHQKIASDFQKDILLYMNFEKHTYLLERQHVANLFANQSYCKQSSPKGFQEYLLDLARSKFVLSPRGNGLDCHRTWESLLMGAIPIVKTSSLDPLYTNLPVLIINDWNEINEEFLLRKYEEIQSKNYSNEKAYVFYWLDLINSYKLR